MTEKEFIDQRYRDLESLNKRRWGWLQWFVVAVIVAVGIGIAIPAINVYSSKPARMLQASNNARQIIIALKTYAGDNNWNYPSGRSANDVFRVLIRSAVLEGWTEDKNIERIFTSPASPYLGDNEIGTAPDFNEAVRPGENHWAMTKGLTDESNGNIPLVFENPATASWPPMWDNSVAGQPKPGRTWKSGKILVGRNDGSVTLEKLALTGDKLVTLEHNNEGKNLFEQAGPHHVLDIAK